MPTDAAGQLQADWEKAAPYGLQWVKSLGQHQAPAFVAKPLDTEVRCSAAPLCSCLSQSLVVAVNGSHAAAASYLMPGCRIATSVRLRHLLTGNSWLLRPP